MTAAAPTRVVDMGGLDASAQPCYLKTILGSCIAACLYDPIARIGGMNHFLLPTEAHPGSCDRSSRFGAHSMELLINSILRLGGQRQRLVAKVFGAANVLAGMSSPTVGELNALFVLEYLQKESIPLLGHRLGGILPMQVVFHTSTGQAFVRSIKTPQAQQEVSREADLVRLGRALTPAKEGDVELFEPIRAKGDR